MLSYNQLQKRPKDFLAMTGLQLDEFRKLFVAFEATYLQHSPQELTLEGHARQRHVGGGAKGALTEFRGQTRVHSGVSEDQPVAQQRTRGNVG